MQYTSGAALYCNVVYLILKRPLGLYALIDEESKFPKATANSLLLQLTVYWRKSGNTWLNTRV